MWNNSPQFPPQQGPSPYNYRYSTMSDQMSVSSVNTGVMSHHAQNTNGNSYHSQFNNNRNDYNSPPQAHPNHGGYISSQSQNPHTNSYRQSFSPNPQPHPQTPSSPHPQSLTGILLNSSPQSFTQATQHPFLRHAGLGTLPKPALSRWLSQDRLYAQSYIGFIGALISRVDLPYVMIHDHSTSLRWRIVSMLSSALSNIHRELEFFTNTAHKYSLALDAPSRADGVFTAEPATKQYIDLFRAFGTDPSMSLLEGLVVLWATETVYLSAWSYASSFINAPEAQQSRSLSPRSESGVSQIQSPPQLQHHPRAQSGSGSPGNGNGSGNGTPPPTTNPHSVDLDGGALRNAFIPNWTSSEFEAFVAEIAELTDLLAEREDAVARKLDVYKAVWRHILDIERRFWPAVEGG
ncbi:uncharacterized protein Z518_10502 [Rhinocladiella mackenziei CBS 650.93]|uniref:Rhinocladiella mackenziei CBS 650.93 unplaced genomic scaffold supercont1.9, whole genome shotgun sequence n=1 Tax=Rhinocladiella mackenziei CBS 650.93 TaxID=1442369 RepID=A0A0D2GPS9_9EURO|nr:uncharacterized protein Z518_10502 [Rhinocladiella mackenziei CBS 650.93]KIX00363.1 hypothetical protein Z518_10502 [Rhinocladiella mackenziei CBS 650.93]